MKIHFWYIVVFCFILSIIAYRAAVDFRQRSARSADFEILIRDASLPIRCLFLDPNQLKVKKWRSGDYSAYQLKSNLKNKTISIQVAAVTNDGEENLHWVKINGFRQFNNQVEIENWKLVSQRSFQRENEIQSFDFIEGFIPISNGFRIDSTISRRIELDEIGDKVIKTPGGYFQCTHYFASIVSEEGEREPFLELWVNTDVRPLGIVRARWRHESIEIIEFEPNRSVDFPKIGKTLLDIKNTGSNQSCIQCHVAGIGGKSVNLVESGYAIAGAELDLTQAHFHPLQAGLVKMKDPIHLRIASKNKQLTDEVVRFTWKNGSFSVKSDRYGDIFLSMDAVLHQGHLRVIPHQGRLGISFYNTSPKRDRILKWLTTVENERSPQLQEPKGQ